ncbi:MAG: sigma-70 family RNA polymerase sigma factor [Prochloraceae cyanobacterium]
MLKVLADDCCAETTTDKDLVLRCRKGDRSAFRQLYRRYHQRIRSTLYQLCGEYLLEDLLQEVFLRAWKGLPKLRQPEYFPTWIYRITWNVATDRRRELAKLARMRLKTAEPNEEEQLLNNTASRPEDSPDLMQLHYQDLIRRGLDTLSLEHRIVLVLHDLEDLPQKEIAKILKLPVGTIKSRLFYARKAIEKYLKDQGVSL